MPNKSPGREKRLQANLQRTDNTTDMPIEQASSRALLHKLRSYIWVRNRMNCLKSPNWDWSTVQVCPVQCVHLPQQGLLSSEGVPTYPPLVDLPWGRQAKQLKSVHFRTKKYITLTKSGQEGRGECYKAGIGMDQLNDLTQC